MAYIKTYRVQGLPATYTQEGCEILLNSVLGHDSENPESTVHSLGVDPCSSEDARYLTATITFKKEPSVLQDGKSQWALSTLTPRCSNTRGIASSITVDNNFLGFTPLNSFENDSSHKIEYVAWYLQSPRIRSLT
jgi:hypothetical protein